MTKALSFSSSLAQQPLSVKACLYHLWGWLSVTYGLNYPPQQDSQSYIWGHGPFGAGIHDGPSSTNIHRKKNESSIASSLCSIDGVLQLTIILLSFSCYVFRQVSSNHGLYVLLTFRAKIYMNGRVVRYVGINTNAHYSNLTCFSAGGFHWSLVLQGFTLYLKTAGPLPESVLAPSRPRPGREPFSEAKTKAHP